MQTKIIQGINLQDIEPAPIKELQPLCRKLAAEGSVLLKNDGVLPIKKATKVALFGRIQESYIKSGTGSGGLVKIERLPCILDSFLNSKLFELDNELINTYKEWIKDNPFDNGSGWATEPWAQEEMPISKEFAQKMSQKNDIAIMIVNRTAGEDRDNDNTEGSFKLTATEYEAIKNISSAFEKTIVVLNVGNLIDLSFMDDCSISALLYNWQGGQEGADALVDLLSGKISPSGKLPDTQTFSTDDYISLDDFGSKDDIVYKEDVYVGYRYFETFCPEKVRYPFGFGLTYTEFSHNYTVTENNGIITVEAEIENIGNFTAKEVVQVYFGAPCGKLGTPSKQLIGFAKTNDLKSGESQKLSIEFSIEQMAAYDDSGVTGNKSCFVLEKGDYTVFVGTDVRAASAEFTYNIPKTVVTQKLQEAMAPASPFLRLVAKEENGKRTVSFENTPKREIDLESRIRNNRDKAIPFTDDKGIKLVDVANGKNSIDEFIAQLTDNDLFCLICGEGMNSPKVTGSGAAFGGVTDTLLHFGIPICSASDGPSGLRLRGEPLATQIPNGYVFASSFDQDLTQQIFELLGVEMYAYQNDVLLAPGMNIHRHPLCGRNFEYFSEDPLLTGKMAAAQTRGLAAAGGYTTVKHFCCNNQEYLRYNTNSVVSERALREIYLKGFEIAVKEADVKCIMTSYNLINGYHAASNYDLTTTVLRNDWGFKGLVMTDWWANCNSNPDKNSPRTRENLAAMIRCQNDIYMVCVSSESKVHNLIEGLESGFVTRSDLQRCAKNILNFIISSPAFERFVEGGCIIPDFENLNQEQMQLDAVIENPIANQSLESEFGDQRTCLMVITLLSNADSIAQSSVNIKIDDTCISLLVEGTGGKAINIKRKIKIDNKPHKLSFEFPPSVEIKKISIYKQI